MKRTNTITKLAVAGTLFFSAIATAQAGGLFGDGGLIRGDIGRIFDKHVEKPITTPLARQGAVAAGTAAGAFLGGKAGNPAIGGMIGNQMGHCVNSIFAGGNCGMRGRPAPVQHGGMARRAPMPVQNGWGRQGPAVGAFCLTSAGRAGPGPVQQIGNFCRDNFGLPGRIVR